MSVAGRNVEPVTAIGTFDFTAPLWLHPGGSWHFVSVPADTSEEIDDLASGIRRGFGSLRVGVTVGTTTWQTSIFPDSRNGTYLLPVKREVRLAEKLVVGDDIRAKVRIMDL